MLFSLFLVTFSQQAPILCVYSVFGGLTMAAPVGHLTIKFNGIRFNSLGLLIIYKQNPFKFISRGTPMDFQLKFFCTYDIKGLWTIF